MMAGYSAKRIVHIIPDQKFTTGYIHFMNKKVVEKLEHYFIVLISKNENKFELPKARGVRYKCADKAGCFSDESVLELLKTADKIIVSGIFDGIDFGLSKLERKILSKTFLHFWGGDFYSYRDTKFFSKKYIHKRILGKCIKRCAGIITLVPGDYDELSKIFPNRKPHFVASMPDDPERSDDYEKYLRRNTSTNKILVGNSATKENCHLEVFKLLKHLRNDNIRVICPLSYGDDDYAKEVIAAGRNIFGEKFVPLCDYQSFEEYKNSVASCSVGIFANNRQQAMGNIAMMLKMGKKLYLRKGTSMWNSYMDYNLKIYPLEDIRNATAEGLFRYNKKTAIQNNEKIRRLNSDYANNWSIILNI